MKIESAQRESRFEYKPSEEQEEKLTLLSSLVESLQASGVRFAVAGGYGLDALYGSLTRDHKDYDLMVFDESEHDFAAVVNGLGFQYDRTKNSGTVVYQHQEIGIDLECMPASKLQAALEATGISEVTLDTDDAITVGNIDGVSLPTFNFAIHQAFDVMQNKRIEDPSDPHAAHKLKIYEALSRNG